MAGACTIDDVKAKCAAERKKLGRWDKKGHQGLRELHELVKTLSLQLDDTESGDADELLLLPLADKDDKYILVDGEDGVDIVSITHQTTPKRLGDGTAYAYCLPFASESSLKRMLNALKTTHTGSWSQ